MGPRLAVTVLGDRGQRRARQAAGAAQQLLAAGETVVEVPATLAARARLLRSGHGRKTDVGAVTPLMQEYMIDDVDRLGWKPSRRLKFCGNNGFARGFGRDQAMRVVSDIPAGAHRLVLGALLASGQRSSGVKRLADLLK